MPDGNTAAQSVQESLRNELTKHLDYVSAQEAEDLAEAAWETHEHGGDPGDLWQDVGKGTDEVIDDFMQGFDQGVEATKQAGGSDVQAVQAGAEAGKQVTSQMVEQSQVVVDRVSEAFEEDSEIGESMTDLEDYVRQHPEDSPAERSDRVYDALKHTGPEFTGEAPIQDASQRISQHSTQLQEAAKDAARLVSSNSMSDPVFAEQLHSHWVSSWPSSSAALHHHSHKVQAVDLPQASACHQDTHD